jgi:hypothetical protein
MAKNLVAFVSYTHYDDKFDEGAITQLAGRLEGALKAFTDKMIYKSLSTGRILSGATRGESASPKG